MGCLAGVRAGWLGWLDWLVCWLGQLVSTAAGGLLDVPCMDTGGLKSGDSFEDGSFLVESMDEGKYGK